MGSAEAIDEIRRRARAARADSLARWTASTGARPDEVWVRRLRTAGRSTVNFHPDRIGRNGSTVAASLLASGRYQSQWATGISAGSRSAMVGGERHRFEHRLFAGAHDDVDPVTDERPIYGALDVLVDHHGGSPRFGSCFLVLRSNVRDRITLCIGDSHTGPSDVGTFDEPWSILAGLGEQAAERRLLDRVLGIDALLAVLEGQHLPRSASRDLDGYVEIQVHGGVDLSCDVEAIVLDPSFRGTDVERDLAGVAARHGVELGWHRGSALAVDDVPADFRGPAMPTLARRVAGAAGIVDARAIGVAAAEHPYEEPSAFGDPHESTLQQLKHLWHTLLVHGHDATPSG